MNKQHDDYCVKCGVFHFNPCERGGFPFTQEQLMESEQMDANQLRDTIANSDQMELLVINRNYAQIRNDLAEMGHDVDIQTVMVVVDQMATQDQYFVRLANTIRTM